MPEIKVTATADVKGAVSGLEALSNALGGTDAAARKTAISLSTLSTSVSKIPAPFANSAIGVKAFEASISKLNTSLPKFGTGANQATNAMTNLGRVIQDAPFGIIGITNNINPLLESFQRLKAETGSTKQALSALGSSLIGGGGLGLAVSVVTSLMTVFAMQAMKHTGDAAEETTKKIQSFNDILKSVASSVAKEETEVLGLIGVLKSETETRERKLAAIKELQKIQPEIFAGLKLEKDAVIGLDAAYAAYLANLKNVIQAKIIQQQLETAITRQLELQKNLSLVGQSVKPITDLTAKSLELAKAQKEVNDEIFRTRKILGTGLTAAQTVGELKTLDDTIQNLTKQLFALSKTIVLPVKEIKLKPEKVTIDTEHFTDFLGIDKVPFVKALTIKPDVTIVPNVKEVVITPEQNAKILKGLKALFDQAKLEKFQADVNAAISNTVNNIATSAVESFATAIGQALVGQSSLPNLFGSLMKNIGAQIKDLGKYMVKTGIEFLGLQKALSQFKSKPGLTIAAGFALEILGSVLEAQANKKYNSVGGFASGTTAIPRGGFFDVGERGRERIFLPAGSSVQPNNELNAYGGGQSIFIPAVTLSGSDLVIAFNRASQQMGRNN